MILYSDFNVDGDDKKVIATCPRGHKAINAYFSKAKKTYTLEFSKITCDKCHSLSECYVSYSYGKYKVKIFSDHLHNKSLTLEKLKQKDFEYYREVYEDTFKLYGRNLDNMSVLDSVTEKFMEIISAPTIYGFTTGAYVCLANILFIKHSLSLKDCYSTAQIASAALMVKDEVAEEYLKKALELKPTNDTALYLLALYKFSTEAYTDSFNLFMQLKKKEHIDEFFELVTCFDKNLNYFTLSNSYDKLLNLERVEFYEKMYEKQKGSIVGLKFGYLLAKYCKINELFLKGYDISKSLIKYYPDIHYGYYLVVEFCSGSCLNRPSELLEHAQKCINQLNIELESDISLLPDIEQTRFSVESNIAMAYLSLGKYDEVIKRLEPKVKSLPNNTDLYNLSRAYFELGKYELALDMVTRAMYFFEDEMSLHTLACIYREMNRHTEAVEYFKKAIYFIENSNKDVIVFKDGYINVSRATSNQQHEKLREYYNDLIACLMSHGNYKDAWLCNQSAKEQFGTIDLVVKNERILSAALSLEKQNVAISNNLEQFKADWKREKELFSMKITKLRTWVSDLMKIQSLMEEKKSIETDEFWVIYEKHMDSIIEKMKLDSSESKVDFSEIRSSFECKYDCLSNKALSCLATAEYLYRVNKNSIIDFAPIVVEFTKVFEIELNEIFDLFPNKMMGELIYFIQDLNDTRWNKIVDNLFKLKKIRNGSAHTGLSTLQKVEDIRTMMFKEGLLDYILKQKSSRQLPN